MRREVKIELSLEKKIDSLSSESEGCTISNLAIEGTVEDLIKEQEKFIGSSKNLKSWEI